MPDVEQPVWLSRADAEYTGLSDLIKKDLHIAVKEKCLDVVQVVRPRGRPTRHVGKWGRPLLACTDTGKRGGSVLSGLRF